MVLLCGFNLTTICTKYPAGVRSAIDKHRGKVAAIAKALATKPRQ